MITVLRRVAARIGHESIPGEFDYLEQLDDPTFQFERSRHLVSPQKPAQTPSMGVTLLLAAMGALAYAIAAVVARDLSYAIAAAAWAVIAAPCYWYVTSAAKYWRRHRAIQAEEVRRFGSASFG